MNSPAIYLPMPSAVTQSWRHSLPALVFLLVCILYLYRNTAETMVMIWTRSETFTHGFLVLPMVIWLVWRKRLDIAVQEPRPEPVYLVGIACVSFFWLIGNLAAINALSQFAFVSLLVLTVPTLLGRSVAHQILFPLGFLFFSVPIGEFLLPQFMDWTANFTIFALRLSGIPVYREGLYFVIPSGNWSVVEACSGVRYLIASLTVGTLFAYLHYQSFKRRILFIIVSIIVPVVANWLRAYFIVILGHLSGNRLATGVDHLIYGWIFFGVVILLMFIIGARWSEPEKRMSMNVFHFQSHQKSVPTAKLWITTGCFVALMTLPLAVLWAIDQEDDSPVHLVAPETLSVGWKVASQGDASYKPDFQNVSAETNNIYIRDGHKVGLYLGYYRHQNYERKLVSSSNVLVSSKDTRWAKTATGSRMTTLSEKNLSFRTAELRENYLNGSASQERLNVWQVYWINGTLTSSDYLAKAYGAYHHLLGHGDESAVIVVYTEHSQTESSEVVLDQFLKNNLTAITELLRKTARTN